VEGDQAMYDRKPVDVILQNNTDGTIIPLRLRLEGEDGEKKQYRIMAYMDLSHQGARTFADGVYISNRDLAFRCKVLINDQIRIVNLYRKPSYESWFVTNI